MKKITAVITAVIFFFLLIRLFFLDIYNIPSDSMYSTLKINDKVVINTTKFSGLSSYFSTNEGKSYPINRGDIYVFKIKMDDPNFYIKRCIGLPGDTIKLSKSGRVKINEKIESPFPGLMLYYKIYHRSFKKFEAFCENMHINYYDKRGYQRNSNYIFIKLSIDESIKLSKENFIDSIIEEKYNVLEEQRLVIPKKGYRIKLNSENYKIYSSTINTYEGVIITEKGNEFSMNGKLVDNYMFKNNYIFFMGDNRNSSKDSRDFGPIPIQNITGILLTKI